MGTKIEYLQVDLDFDKPVDGFVTDFMGDAHDTAQGKLRASHNAYQRIYTAFHEALELEALIPLARAQELFEESVNKVTAQLNKEAAAEQGANDLGTA